MVGRVYLIKSEILAEIQKTLSGSRSIWAAPDARKPSVHIYSYYRKYKGGRFVLCDFILGLI